MARKESITLENILTTAFEMTREEGYQNATARKVAAKAGCSTQPIFRVYKNMEELSTAVYDKAVEFFRDYYDLYPRTSGVPFTNLGMANLPFKKSLYEILNGENGNVKVEITSAAQLGCKDAGAMFMQMWIMIHGIACMSLTGDYDLSEQETKAFLENSYSAFAAN